MPASENLHTSGLMSAQSTELNYLVDPGEKRRRHRRRDPGAVAAWPAAGVKASLAESVI